MLTDHQYHVITMSLDRVNGHQIIGSSANWVGVLAYFIADESGQKESNVYHFTKPDKKRKSELPRLDLSVVCPV